MNALKLGTKPYMMYHHVVFDVIGTPLFPPDLCQENKEICFPPHLPPPVRYRNNACIVPELFYTRLWQKEGRIIKEIGPKGRSDWALERVGRTNNRPLKARPSTLFLAKLICTPLRQY